MRLEDLLAKSGKKDRTENFVAGVLAKAWIIPAAVASSILAVLAISNAERAAAYLSERMNISLERARVEVERIRYEADSAMRSEAESLAMQMTANNPNAPIESIARMIETQLAMGRLATATGEPIEDEPIVQPQYDFPLSDVPSQELYDERKSLEEINNDLRKQPRTSDTDRRIAENEQAIADIREEQTRRMGELSILEQEEERLVEKQGKIEKELEKTREGSLEHERLSDILEHVIQRREKLFHRIMDHVVEWSGEI